MKSIDLDKTDPLFRRELLQRPGGDLFTACFACRTCSSSCPIAVVDPRFDPAKIIRMALYGLREEILASDLIWLCTGCYTCQERCPQGVRITDLITSLKNLAVQAEHMPSGIRAQRDIVKTEGRIYPLDDFDNKKRAKIGLPELPTSCDRIGDLFPPE
ncbi:MAG: 4Fe-4S dicluster domain-containing protein [Desulfobacteraceae bacterium]|jgi:heterodisulfide reductase subunit C